MAVFPRLPNVGSDTTFRWMATGFVGVCLVVSWHPLYFLNLSIQLSRFPTPKSIPASRSGVKPFEKKLNCDFLSSFHHFLEHTTPAVYCQAFQKDLFLD